MPPLLLGLADLYFHLWAGKAVKAITCHNRSVYAEISKNMAYGIGRGGRSSTGGAGDGDYRMFY